MLLGLLFVGEKGKYTILRPTHLSILRLQRTVDMYSAVSCYPPEWINPDKYDLLLTDIAPDDLPTKLSDALGVAYLAPAQVEYWPQHGKIYGYNKRILFSLPVTGRDKTVSVHFIFDTGAPATYIAPSVLDALGIPEVSIYSEVIRFNGVKFGQFAISHTHEKPTEQQRRIAGLIETERKYRKIMS